MQIIATNRLHNSQAEDFVQELARQAIVDDTSMLSREIGYGGFARVPILSESLFTDPFVLQFYRPMSKMMYLDRNIPLTKNLIRRLTGASEMMIKTALREHGMWGAQYLYDVKQAYEDLSCRLVMSKDEAHKDYPEATWSMSINTIHGLTRDKLGELDIDDFNSLFQTQEDNYRDDVVATVSDIIYDSLSEIANEFQGYNGRFWTHAIGLFMDVYPFHENEPAGMDPLQQTIAIKILDKMNDNMDGWYPAITRVMLAVIGPYESHPTQRNRSAYVILKDAVYLKLQRLQELHQAQPSKVEKYLPENVTYDPQSNTLTHRFSGGGETLTHLNDLNIAEVNLYDAVNWRVPEQNIG